MTGTEAFNFGRVLKLLTGKHSADDRERHLHALGKMAKRNADGYRFTDLPVLTEIAGVVVAKAAGGLNPSYYDALCKILAPIERPFAEGRRSQAEAQDRSVVELLGVLATTFVNPDTPTNVQAVLASIILKYTRIPASGQAAAAAAGSNLSIVAQSAVPVSIATACVAAAAKPKDAPLLNLLFLLAEVTHSPDCAARVIEAGQAGAIAEITRASTSPELAAVVTEILWNLLEHADAAAAREQLNAAPAAEALAACFHRALLTAQNVAGRDLRNDIATVLLMLLDASTAATVAGTSILEDVCRAFTAAELPSKHPDCKNFRLAAHEEDFELHKILMLILENAARFDSCRDTLAKGKVMLLLFHYSKRERGSDMAMRKWRRPQREELELLAVRGIATIGAHVMDQLLVLRGSTQLLDFCSWCVQDTTPDYASGVRAFPGAGNSLLSSGDFSSGLNMASTVIGERNNGRRSQLLQCLRTIRSLAYSAAGEKFVVDLCDQGAIEQLLEILAVGEPAGVDRFDLAIWQEALLLVSKICETEFHFKELLGDTGLETTLKFIRIDPGLFAADLGHKAVVLSAVDLVWCSVVSCSVNMAIFLRQEGMFAMLDLLDRAPKDLYNIVLGCVLDLCEDEEALSHVKHWRSSRAGVVNYTVAHLLVGIWRGETVRLKIERGADHVIGEGSHPLMAAGWQAADPDGPDGSVAEVIGSLRSKIFAIFAKTGFDVYVGLSAGECATLEEIRAYLKLKNGEVWREIANSLARDGVVPTETDQELLDVATAANATTVDKLQATQRAIVDASAADAEAELEQKYVAIHARHFAEQEELRQHGAFVQRTARHDALQLSREIQQDLLATSRARCDEVDGGDAVVRHEDEIMDNSTCTVFASTVTLTGLLQPGADGTADDDKLEHTFRGALGAEISV